jgi:hypothetical protein
MTKEVNRYTIIASVCLVMIFCVIGCVTLFTNIQSIRTKEAIYEYRFSRNPKQTRDYSPMAEQDSIARAKQEERGEEFLNKIRK